MTEPNGGLSGEAVEQLRNGMRNLLSETTDAEAERKAAAKLRGSEHTLVSTVWKMADLLKELVEEHVALKRYVLEFEQRDAERRPRC
jgi:hypothetical protein